MATQLEKFDSTGGFSIDKTTVVDLSLIHI